MAIDTIRIKDLEEVSVNDLDRMWIVVDSAAPDSTNKVKLSAMAAYIGGVSDGKYIPLAGSSEITGSLIPKTNKEHALGSDSFKWLALYAGEIHAADVLSIPQASPAEPELGKLYLYAGNTGSYSQVPSGGGTAEIYDLYIKRGNTQVGPYDLSEQDQTVDISTLFTGYATETWVSNNFNNYTLPTASSSVLGGIKIGTGLLIDNNGVVSVTGQTQGTVTRVDVGISQYNPDSSGVISLPAYPSTPSSVGLGNVTNDAQVKRTEMGAASGVATLGTDGKIPSSQLPSYVDDVLEYASTSAFPSTGESGKIYVALDTNKTYRWSGTGYVEISPSIVIGTTTGTAFDGKSGYDHVTDGDIHVTAALKTAWSAKYDKPSGGIPATDLADTYLPLSAGSSKPLTNDLYFTKTIYGADVQVCRIGSVIDGGIVTYFTNPSSGSGSGTGPGFAIINTPYERLLFWLGSTDDSWEIYHEGNLTKGVLTTLLESNNGYYVKKSGDTMTGTLNSQSIIPTSNDSYDLGASVSKWNNIYTRTIYATIAKIDGLLAIPTEAPQSGFIVSGEAYLYSSTGSYAETPGGGVANVYPLTITKNGSTWLSYNPGVQAESINLSIPTKVSDLTNDTGFITASSIPSTYAWSAITNTPTTLSGYGITDAKIETPSGTTNKKITLGSNNFTIYSWALASSKPSYAFSDLTTHPTTISGYGITDAKIANGVITLGSNSITPITSSDHKALTLKVGSTTIGSDYNALAAKTYTITAQNITDAIGSTTYAPYNANGYVPTTRKVNNKALSSDITLSLDDVADGSTRKLANYLPLTGGYISNSENNNPLRIKTTLANTNGVYLPFYVNTTKKTEVGYWSGYGAYLANTTGTTQHTLKVKDDGTLGFDSETVWHSGNDGASSGLDADLLDGEDGSYYNNLLAYYSGSSATSATGIKYPLALLSVDTPNSSYWWYVTSMYYSRVGGGYCSQIATTYSHTLPDLYIRQIYNSTATSWYKVYHDGNLTKSVLTTLLDSNSGYYLPLAGGTMTGAIVPNAANTIDFGTSTYYWKGVYAGTLYGTLNDFTYLTNHALNIDNAAVKGVNFHYANAGTKPTGSQDGSAFTLAWSSAWVTQMYGDWRTNKFYTRVKTNGTWGDWAELATTKGTVEGLNTSTETDATFVHRAVPSVAVGDVARVTKVKGKTIVWNQKVTNGNFATNSDWAGLSGTVSISGGVGTYTITTVQPDFYSNQMRQGIANCINGHKYYYGIDCKASKAMFLGGLLFGARNITPSATAFTRFSGVTTYTGTTGAHYLYMCFGSGATRVVGDSFDVRNIFLCDLTLMFGAGNEPTAAEFEALYSLPFYSYNTGELVSNKAESIETIGFNMWDEIWESGYYNENGVKTPDPSNIRSKNMFRIFPNTSYYANIPSGTTIRICYYDAEGNFLRRTGTLTAGVITTDVGAYYAAFYMSSAYGTIYKNDICINLSDTTKNGTYEPYRKDSLPLNITKLKVDTTNLWDEQWEQGTLDTNGADYASTINIRNKGYIPVEGGKTYYVKGNIQVYEYGASKNYITRTFLNSGTITLNVNTCYLRWRSADNYTYTEGDIWINTPTKRPPLKLNQMFENGDFSNGTTGWGYYNSSISAQNGALSVQVTQVNGGFTTTSDKNPTLIGGHKYFIQYAFNSPSATSTFVYFNGNSFIAGKNVKAGYNVYAGIGTISTTATGTVIVRFNATGTYTVYSIVLIDLTKMYGQGLEPTDTEIVSERIGLYRPYTTGEYMPYYAFPKGMRCADYACSVCDEVIGKQAIVKVGAVDLGLMSWTRDSSGIFYTGSVPGSVSRTSGTTHMILPKYNQKNASSSIGGASSNGDYCQAGARIAIYDTGYSDAVSFQRSLNSVKLYFELSTPIFYDLETAVPELIECDVLGTQRRLPEDTASLVQAPFHCDFQYGANPGEIVSDSAYRYLPLAGGTVYGTLEASGELIIPDHAPYQPEPNKHYLYVNDNGNYYQS